MTLKQMLARYSIELRHFQAIWWPPPHFQWIKSIEIFTRRYNALQAWCFIKETCNFPDDGMLCEVSITGKHEFLRGGISNYQGQVWL